MDRKSWKKRIKYRGDLTSKVTHLTKGKNEVEAFENLIKILEKKCIKGSTSEKGFICGEMPAVCFMDMPIVFIAENLRYEKRLREQEKQKIRYMGFGVRFQKEFIYKYGGRPVIYDENYRAKSYLAKSEWRRIVSLNLVSQEMIDWSHEREWRVPQKLVFKYSQCEIILPSDKYYRRFVNYCLRNGREDILLGIRGIITLSSIYY